MKKKKGEKLENSLEKLQKELDEKNKKLFRNTVELTEIRNKLEDRNYELEQLNKEIKEKNTKLFRNTVELTEIRNKLEDRNYELEQKEKHILKTNKKLEKVNQELKKLDREKDEFISIAAHELKTPLTSIKGFTQLLLNPKLRADKKKMKHYLELINKNTMRLYNLVVDLVDSSRISLGQIKIHPEIIDTKVLMKELDENMHMAIEEKGLKSEFKVNKNTSKIFADQERVMQILRNLIINAVHFTEKGSIKVKASDQKNQVLFEVSDTGQGIPKDQQKNIFSRFYQVDSSLRRKVGGSGLGLSVCEGLVRLMKGKIWLESEEGKGTTFFFTIPKNK